LSWILLNADSVAFSGTEESAFLDVETHWAKKNIAYLVSKDIINGYADGTFKPNASIKRSEFVKLTMSALGHINLPGKEGKWYQGYLDKAVELDVLEDRSNETIYTFPTENITREEAAYVIYKTLVTEESKYDDTLKSQLISEIKDYESVQEKYENTVLGAYSKGIITGYEDHTFKPKGELTRGEATVMIERMINKEIRKSPENEKVLVFQKAPEFIFEEPVRFKTTEDKKEFIDVLNLLNEYYEGHRDSVYIKWGVNEEAGSISASIMPNVETYSSATLIDGMKMTKWSICMGNSRNGSELYKTPYSIDNWRNSDFVEYQEIFQRILGVFFEEDSKKVVQIYKKLLDAPPLLTEEKFKHITEYTYNNRKIIFKNTSGGLEMHITFITE